MRNTYGGAYPVFILLFDGGEERRMPASGCGAAGAREHAKLAASLLKFEQACARIYGKPVPSAIEWEPPTQSEYRLRQLEDAFARSGNI